MEENQVGTDNSTTNFQIVEANEQNDRKKKCDIKAAMDPKYFLFHNLPHMVGLIFVKAGLILSELGLVRGNHNLFRLAFAVCMIFGAFEAILNLIRMILLCRHVSKNPFKKSACKGITFYFNFF